jgi:hypothetical protein
MAFKDDDSGPADLDVLVQMYSTIWHGTVALYAAWDLNFHTQLNIYQDMYHECYNSKNCVLCINVNGYQLSAYNNSFLHKVRRQMK